MKSKKKTIKTKIVCLLIIFTLLLSYSPIFTNLFVNPDNITGLRPSATNTLFNGKSYPFELNDFYDDEDLDKVWTGAKFQTESFNDTSLEWNEDVANETVSSVNNTETQYGASSGNYLATYTFDDQPVGTSGTDIDFVDTDDSSADCTTMIIASLDGHKKVLQLYDNNAAGRIMVYNSFPALEFGTVELFIRSSDVTQDADVFISTGGADTGIHFSLRNDNFRYYDGAWNDIVAAVDDTWYHVRIDFECGAGDYLGLLPDTFYVTINGTRYGSYAFRTAKASVTYVSLVSGTPDTGYYFYVDAVGYWWDSGYTPFEHHAGTYSFTNYADGTEGYDITGFADYYSAGADTSGKIISNFYDHKKVLELKDENAAGSVGIRHNFDYTEVDSTIEFWLASNTTSSGYRGLYVNFYDQDYVSTICLVITNAVLRYYNGTSDYTIYTITANEFFHVKLVLDDTTDTYDIYVNGDLKETDINYINPSTSNAYRIYFATRSGNTGYKMYVDALGYSGDPYYTIGDNLLPSTGNLYPDNIDMIKGSYDYTDNMKVNDDSSTNFTSTHTDGYIYEMPSQWDNFTFTEGTGDTIGELETIDADWSVIDSTHTEGTRYEAPVQWGEFSFTKGSGGATGELETNNNVNYATIDSSSYVPPTWRYITTCPMTTGSCSGTIANAKSDDGNYFTLTAAMIMADVYILRTNYLGFNIAPGGSAQYISYYLWSSSPNVKIYINDGVWKTGNPHLNADNQYHSGVNNVRFYATGTSAFTIRVYYFRMDGVDSVNAKIDVSATWTIPDTIQNFYYDYKTTVAVDCDLDIYDWVAENWNTELQSNTGTGWITNSYDLVANPNKVSGSNQVSVRFQTAEYAGNFDLQLDQLSVSYIDEPALIDVQIDMQVNDPDLSSIEFFKYSHKTNVSVDVDLDIWNWGTSTWYEIESVDNFATFDDDSFTLGSASPYVSGTNQVRIRFQVSSLVSDFELQIDRFRLDYLADPAELEMTITFLFDRYNEDLLVMNLESWQKTNISQTITLMIWNYDTGSYVQISSSSDTSFTKKEYNTESPSDFISPSGLVKLRWNGSDLTNNFELQIDYLLIQIYYKLDLVHSKSFDTNGIYRYRWIVLGSIHYTDWTVFEVIDPIPNFYAISESDYTTRWILQGSDISSIEDFHDDVNTDYWNLVDVSDISMFMNVTPTDDAKVSDFNAGTNYGSDIYIGLYAAFGDTILSLLKYDYGYLDLNYTTNSTFYGYKKLDTQVGHLFYIYHTSDFSESTVTWNNQPATGTIQNEYSSVEAINTWVDFDIGAPNKYYKFIPDSADLTSISFYSTEGTYTPKISHDLSKNYFGGGYMYMQTNETELISLKSIDYGVDYNLSSGDYFEVDFQTSSDSKIELILLKDGGVNKTLTLSGFGNTNFNRHTVQISVDEYVEFDQLKISSTFEDTDNVKVYDIKTYKYTITGDYADFYIGSKRDYEVYLTPDIYNLRIFEEGNEKVNGNITIPETGVLQYIYTPTELLECRLALFSLAEEYLQFEDYHVNVNRSLNGIYGDFELLEPIFLADEGTYVYIDVSDRFDALIYSDFELAKTYMDLYIEVYSLKIRNEATEIVDYMLQNIDTGSSKSGTLFSDEIVEYHVKSGDYSLDYTNYEDMYPRECNFELTTHKTISINSTYHTVYIGLFTYDGLGLNRDWVRLYINDVRADFGFNVIDSETANLTVLDYFNNTLESVIIDASAYSEYNLYVQVYSMYILNQFTYSDLIMNITQVDSGYYMNQLIPSSSALLYRFIPDINYTIKATYVNGTVYSIRTVNLTDNSQIESFGVPSAPSEYPKDVYFGVYTTTGLGIDRDLLRFYIDGNRTDFGFNRITDMIITLVVKDYFNTTLFNQNVNTSGIYEYNILITLYSLKVKNEARVSTNYTLKLGGLETTGYILPEEIIEYQLSSNNYVFDYTNNEDDSFHTININLNQDRVYVLSSTYYDTYFSLYDQNGVRLDDSLFSLYLNGTRKDFGFVELESTDVLVVVQDYLNFTVFNSVVVLSDFTEYNIIVIVFELQIRHLSQRNSNLTLYETTTHNHINFSMSPDSLNKYVLSDSIYNITWVNGENGLTTVYDITLDKNYILTLNTTYYNIFFSLYDVNLHVINPYQYEFRLNDTIQDFGSIIDLQTDDYNITITDRFGISLFNNIVNLRGLNEYRIDITLHELQISHLARYNSDLTLTEDVSGNDYSFIMVPYSFKSIIVGSADYTLDWINGENGLTTSISIALTEDRVVMLNTSYYNIRFNLFDVNLHIIDPSQYVFRLNGTIQDFGLIVDLSTDDYNISVVDRFGTSLFDSIVTLRGLNEYRIDITLYELQIRHLAREIGNMSLYETTIHNSFNFSMAPDTIRSFILGSSTYNITWTNGENGIETVYDINLNLDYILTLDTSYYSIHFSLFDLNLHLIYPSQYEFRLNGSIPQDFGLIEDLITDDYNITITDRFGISLFNNIVNLRGLNEYRIDISLYELQIIHLATENSNLTLTEDISGNDYLFIMAPNLIKSIIVGSADYTLGWTNGENGLITLISIALIEDRVVMLNTSYYDIHFSLFDLNLHLIYPSQYEFRLNGSIPQDFGLIEDLITDDYSISVVDRFGTSLFDSIITLRGLNEYRINITLYELQIKHLATENSNLTLYETTSHNGLNFSMPPDSLRSFILGSSTYNITWLNNENGMTTTYDINLNSDYILTLDTTFYDVYFSLYDQGGVRLDDLLFSLCVNTTRKDFGFVELESNSTLIVVQDYLNVTVFNQVVGLRGSAEYNIIITVFELQIRHLAFENSNLTLYEATSHNYLNFSMAPDSLNKYVLSNSTYNITWVNGENLVSTLYNITLDENYILTLDSTYFDVYFSAFNYDGLGLEGNLFRFYINQARKDFGFNTLKRDTNNLKVLDYFNSTLFDSNVALKQYTEYNLLVEVYALIINNNYSFSIRIEIEREDVAITFEQVIGAQFGMPYRFLPNIEYYIKAYHINGTLLEEKTIELDSNNKIVSFGFYSTEVPIVPRPLEADFYVFIAFIIIVAVLSVIVIVAWAYMKSSKDEVPEDTRLRHKRKRKAYVDRKKGFYDHT